ncbi:MAG: asparagine synthase-related protein [Burkholderiales bacterium]|nr:asparagine synthase-related protein [Burkholderiales bacterium]
MCGIAGIFAYAADSPPVDRAELLRIRDRMAARGPDGAGDWIAADGRIGLAHRRLAIIDLSEAGAQPMHDPATGNVIVFNGEIYNYRELRRELEARGAVFRSQSDTEVLLALYAAYGADMLPKLRGMFAFGIWDAQKRGLLLARDPFGIKPLYIADDGKTLRFASQVKALLAGGALNDTPCPAGICGFFVWGHVPRAMDLCKSDQGTACGSCAFPEGKRPHACSADLFRPARRDRSGRKRGFGARRSVSRNPRCAFRKRPLSPCRRRAGRSVSFGRPRFEPRCGTWCPNRGAKLDAFTLAFDEFRDSAEDESVIAEQTARLLGICHKTERIARADFESERARFLEAMDQPTIDGLNTYLISRSAGATGIKVALSGLGGDELLCGYPSFRQVPRLARALKVFSAAPRLGRLFRRATAPLARRFSKPKAAGLLEYGSTLAGAYVAAPSALHAVGAYEHPRARPCARRPFPARAGGGFAVPDRRNSIGEPCGQWRVEMSCYMRNQLLRDADWAGMAHSLEIRVPFVDPFLFRQSVRLLGSVPRIERDVLLKRASPCVAALIANRPKTGFNTPVATWIAARRGGARLRPWADEVFREFSQRWQVAVIARRVESSPRNILVFRFGQLGDTLVALPAFRILRRRFPEARITVLTAKDPNANWVMAEEVLPQGLVDGFLTYETGQSGPSLGEALRLLPKIRSSRFDLLVYLAPSSRSTVKAWRDHLYFRLAGIADSLGYDLESPYPTRRPGEPLPWLEQEADRLRARLRKDGIDIPVPTSALMRLEPTKADRIAARRFLEEHASSKLHRLVAIGPGSKWPSKRWGEERFAELGRRLIEAFGITPVVLGGREDAALADRLIAFWGKGINGAGPLSIRHAAAVLERCDLYVGNDTGTMHLAAAVGTRCVAIFAAQDWPGRWYPYGQGHIVLRKALPCEGCKLVVCKQYENACLRAISVDEVFEACGRVLRLPAVPKASSQQNALA